MILIVCIDESGGMLFNKRRQSSDSAVINRITEMLGENFLYLDEYSAKLFENKTDKIRLCEDFSRIGEDDFYFAEKADINEALLKAKRIIIYNWNRRYPSDKKFQRENALKGRKQIRAFDFEGTSHEKITEEIYE